MATAPTKKTPARGTTAVREHLFVWEGKDKTGKIIRGEMRATTENVVQTVLRRQGIPTGELDTDQGVLMARASPLDTVGGEVQALLLRSVDEVVAPYRQLQVLLAIITVAGVLLFVAWNMGEWREFARLKHFSGHYRLMLLSTFIVTIVFDLTVAVELGLVLAVVLFVRRQSDIFRIDEVARTERQITFRLYGPLFFGAVAKVDAVVDAAVQILMK